MRRCSGSRVSRVADAVKRLIDVVAAGLGLLILSPVLLIVALLVRVKLGSPVLFRHERPGLHGKPFMLVKFRSMVDADGKLTDNERLTPFGRRLRSTSLDELPELWNVLKGDMSLVGPRPLMPQYLERYSPEQARRHDVRPGLTGWAQVNGRNALTWPDKLALDVWYVDHRSLVLDAKILFMTLAHIVRPRGIGPGGDDIMPEFMGNEEPPQAPRP